MATKYDKHAIHALIDFNWTNLGNSLEFREDGIYVPPPRRAASLTDGELRHLLAHPKNDIGLPALPFPFTVADFIAFCESASIFDWSFVEAPYSNDDGTCDEEAITRLEQLSRPAAALVKARLLGAGERPRRLGLQAQQEAEILNDPQARTSAHGFAGVPQWVRWHQEGGAAISPR